MTPIPSPVPTLDDATRALLRRLLEQCGDRERLAHYMSRRLHVGRPADCRQLLAEAGL